MLLLIDNYDSFIYNLRHYLGELGAEVVVMRNDALTVADALALKPHGIVLSPGPSDPDHAGICLELVRRGGTCARSSACASAMQAIGQACGGRIVRAPVPMHGKLSRHPSRRHRRLRRPAQPVPGDALSLARGRARESAGRARASPPGPRTDSSWALAHRERPLHGVQFHPESIASESGHALLRNFLALAAAESVPA